MTTPSPRPATYARFYETPPQLSSADGTRTWLARGANFVVAYSEVKEGAVLERAAQDDEYMVFLPLISARIEAGGSSIDAEPDTLTIVPPGASRITARGAGMLVRVFSNRATDLLALTPNNATYADGAPEIAPLVAWPDPPAGFKLRNYRLADHVKSGSNMRVFRSTNLMINMLAKRTVPRDTTKLSPHQHSDFEQGSLAIGGTYVHHCRYPWLADIATWRDDEHVEVGSPSLMVVPPKVLHTSMNIGNETGWLIDIFAPPRLDFSLKPDMVCNADEYPLPPNASQAT